MKFKIFILALLGFVQISHATEDNAISNYKLGAGDTISIVVYDEKELSVEKVKLNDAGSISYPMLGEIRVLGLTVSTLQQKVRDGLKGNYLIDPKVTVSIDQYRDIFVNGQVQRPGNFPYQPGLTVRKAVSMAGGFKDRASTEFVSIIHENQEGSPPIKAKQGALVEPGDTINVEESFF
jgi:polysaccharide export outer membrane protein